jgi:hypothetical protein
MSTFTDNHAALQDGTRIFRGRTTEELIPKIVAELGADAIVVRHHKGLTGGFAGFFQRSFVEIEACRGGGQLLDRYDEEDALPALPGQYEADRYADDREHAEADEWAANPFAAALADAEAAVRAAEPAVPPALDAALATALAEAEAAGLPVEPAIPTDHDAALAALADAEAEAEAEMGADARTVAEAEAEVDADARTVAEAEAEMGADARTVAEAEAEVDADARTVAEAEAEIGADARTVAEAEAEVDADARTVAEAEALARPTERAVAHVEDSALANTTSFARVEPLDTPRPAAAPIAVECAEDASERALLERTLLDVGFDGRFAAEAIDAAAAHMLPLVDSPPSHSSPVDSPPFHSSPVDSPPSHSSPVDSPPFPSSPVDSPSSPLSPSPSPLAHAVRRTLQQRIPACPPLPPGPATIALVGPGGSGKSACCATLLDAYRRRSTLPAACLALVADTGDEATQALRNAREEGLLLLDTPPLSPADQASIDALAKALEALAPDRVVLALPATLGAKPAARLLEAYRPLAIGAIALTHIDETDQLGVAVQAACALGLPPAYLLEGEGSGWRLTQVDPADLLDRLLPPR